LGGLARAARYDPAEYMAPARAAFKASFESQVDPEGTLTPAERARRAEALRRAFYARLTLASLKARKARKKAAARANKATSSIPANEGSVPA
jgi:hypothetical protein